MRFLLISLLVVGTVAVSKEGSDDFEHHFLDVRQLVKRQTAIEKTINTNGAQSIQSINTKPTKARSFLDLAAILQGTIDAVAQLPEASKKNTTKKEPEDLYRFLQLPADILTQLASEAGYIEEMPTSTYGPILKTTTKSGIVSGDAGGSFRQMSESEEESIQEEYEHRDAEEKRKREEKEREETERREKEEKEKKEKEEKKRDEEKKEEIKETEEKKERTHHAPIVLQQNFDPSALSTTHAPSFPSLDFSALGLPNLFGQPATVAPPVLPPLPQGLPQPQYAYQPIVQPDGSTLYQQVLILPSSVPFKGPLKNETKIEDPPIVTSTVAPVTEEAFKSETEASTPKSDIHKIRKKKFKINAAKTLTMDKHRDVESEEKKSVEKKEREKETTGQEKSVEKEEGEKKKMNYSHELDKEVIKGNTHLITTVLPSFEEQQRIAQVFEEEYQTHKPLKGVLITHKIESSSPLRIRSIPTRLGDNKYMKLFRQSPILERGAQDDTPDEESLRKKRKGRRKEIRRREEKKTIEMTTEEPSTTTTEESTTTTERSIEMTSSEERSTHPPKQMKKLSITRRIMPMDDEPHYTKNPKIRRRIISRKQEETSEAVNAFTQDMTSHSTESSIEVTTEAATTTTEEPMTTKKMKKMRKVRRRKIKTTTQPPSTTPLPEEDVAFQEEEIVSSKEVIPTAPQANPPPMSFQNAMGELDDLIDPKRIMSKAEKYAALQEKLDETAKEKESDEKSMEKIKKEMSEERVQTSRGEEERENIRDAERSMETTTEKPEEQTTQTVKHKKLRKRRKLRKSTTTTTSTVPPTTTQETLVVTRQHCMNIRSFAFQFGMEDPTDFALMHCSFIENYYPTLTCDRAEEYMVYCREYYK